MNIDNTGDQEISDLLANTGFPIADDLAQLHLRLEGSAQDAGLLDISYTILDSPVGALLVAATEKGLLRVAYESEDLDKVLEVLGSKVSPRILKSSRRLDTVAFEIDEYFGRKRTRFDLPLDLSLSNGFRRLVQNHIPDIPYGTTETYKEVATFLGNPKAVRSVGTACATNPLPIVVPCHRVLRTDGGLGGYIGGLAVKTELLNFEAVGS